MNDKIPAIRIKPYHKEWKKSKLKEVANVYDGVHKTPKYLDEGIMFLSVEDIDTLQSNKFIAREDFKRDFKVYPQKGDVLMTRIGDVGTPNVVSTNELVAYYVSLALIKPFNMDPCFLSNCICSNSFKKGLKERTLTTAVPQKINKNQIGEIEIIYTEDIEEQKSIGEILSKLNRYINFYKSKRNKFINIRDSLLIGLFPLSDEDVPKVRFNNFIEKWEEKPLLSTIVKIIDFRGRTPRKLGLDWSDEGYLALSALNVKKGYIDFSQEAHLGNKELYDKWMLGNELHKGQVLFTTEAPMGNVAQIPDDEKYILSQRTIAFVVNHEKLREDFLAVLLRTKTVLSFLEKLSSGGTAKGVSQKALSKLKIRIPKEIAEQNKVSNLILKLDKLIKLYELKYQKLESLKKATLNKMFV